MNSRTLWAIVAVIIIGLGVWYFAAKRPAAVPPGNSAAPAAATSTTSSAAEGTSLPQPAAVTVTYTDSGFSPKSITITRGQTVTWVNQSAGKMWVASAVHPSHAVYDGTTLAEHCSSGAPKSATTFDECTAVDAGQSFSFTFAKAGTWKYHNHVDAGDAGSVVVTTEPTTGVSASTTLNVQVR